MNILCVISFLTKTIHSFLKKKLALSQGGPQENDAKFSLQFILYLKSMPEIRQFHDNCQIAKYQTVDTLPPVYTSVIIKIKDYLIIN